MDGLKEAGIEVHSRLAHFFCQYIYRNRCAKEQWNYCIRRDKKKSHYLPFLAHCQIVFSKVFSARWTKTFDENQPREQAGCRREYWTVDHHHKNQLIEGTTHNDKPVYVLTFTKLWEDFLTFETFDIWLLRRLLNRKHLWINSTDKKETSISQDSFGISMETTQSVIRFFKAQIKTP